MATALCLMAHWRIAVNYVSLDDGTNARTNVNLEYRRVTIEIDAKQHHDEAHLLGTLRHELLHVTFWPFHLYREHFADLEASGEKARREEQLWIFAVENLVANYEKIFKCLEPEEFKLLKLTEEDKKDESLSPPP